MIGMPGRDRRRIGEILLDRGLITQTQLEEALAAQREGGGQLGRHLILSGAVQRMEMYRALAEQWRAPFVDLVQLDERGEVDAELILTETAETWIERGWLPIAVERPAHGPSWVTVATTIPLERAAAAKIVEGFGVDQVRLVTTTDWDLVRVVQSICRAALVFGAAEALASSDNAASAKDGLNLWQRALPVIAVAVIIVGAVFDPLVTAITVLAIANAMFLVNVGFKVLAGVRGSFRRVWRRSLAAEVHRQREVRGLPEPVSSIPDDDLPIYTILVPAYREANIITKLVSNLGALDYPKTKLDVLLLLEEDDDETIAAVKAMRPPEYVRMLIVPPGGPQTKPRACNYGLAFARGEFVVIYDAEDRPQPQQLRQVVERFRSEQRLENNEQRPLICVQAALNYFNADYNVLTRLFAVEYAHWFDSMLPGMDDWHVPIPLGGTSNHFVTDQLRNLGAWDPYNVTEDADLGMRIAVQGGRVGVVDSVTWEEACAEVPAWVKQRTRWIKGYMMTGAVNARHPVAWLKQNGLPGFITLTALIIGTPLAFLAYPLVLGFTIITYVGVHVIGLNLPDWLVIGGTINMLASNALMIMFAGAAAWRRYNWRIAVFALLNPLYWILHSVAAWRAAWQMYFSPHRWEKTPHGLTEEYEDSSVVAV